MSFNDLPSDWSTRSLSDPALGADVVDLMLQLRDREASSLLALYCDEQLVGLGAPAVVGNMEWRCTAHDRHLAMDRLVGLGAPAVLFAVSARRLLRGDVAGRWHSAAMRACAHAGVTLVGFYTADLNGVHPYGLPWDCLTEAETAREAGPPPARDGG